jgi:hypothetical protein
MASGGGRCSATFSDNERHATESTRQHDSPASFAAALLEASNVVRGWRNTYQFCSDDRLMANLDLEIDKRIMGFHEGFRSVAQP